MKRSHICVLVWLALLGMLMPSGAAEATQLNSWEGSLEGWGISGFGNGTEFVNNSNLGSTDGLESMELGHNSGGFSWDASIVLGSGSPGYQTVSNAYANPVGQTVEFDVIWRASLLNGPVFTFADVAFALQDDNVFRNIFSLGTIAAPQDLTVHVSIPLDSGALAGGIANSGFYRLTFSLNTDLDLLGSTSSVLVDNLIITPEPASLLLVGMAGSMLGLVRRRRHA